MPIFNATIDCVFLCLRQMQLYLDVDSTDNMAVNIGRLSEAKRGHF